MTKKILLRIKKYINKRVSIFFYPLPIKSKKIVFQNFCGKGFGGNPKTIAETMLNKSSDFDLVWLADNLNDTFPKNIRVVKYGSLKSYFELSTSTVWISNVWTGEYTKKKKKQLFIQTWHGSIALKKIEKAVEQQLSKKYVRQAKRNGKNCNLVLSNSSWLTKFYQNNFWYDGPILEKGIPRIDTLYKDELKITKKVYDYFKIDSNKKIVIYAPTFRKNDNPEIYTFEYQLICDSLKKIYNNNYVMLIRLHPNSIKIVNSIKYNQNVINANNYPDMQELLLASDVLITDYSSSMFEMGMINKKVFLYTPDLDSYIKNDRGKLNFDLDTLPFPNANSSEQLSSNILNFDDTIYKNKLNSFYSELGIINTDHASDDVVEYIMNYIKEIK